MTVKCVLWPANLIRHVLFYLWFVRMEHTGVELVCPMYYNIYDSNSEQFSLNVFFELVVEK